MKSSRKKASLPSRPSRSGERGWALRGLLLALTVLGVFLVSSSVVGWYPDRRYNSLSRLLSSCRRASEERVQEKWSLHDESNTRRRTSGATFSVAESRPTSPAASDSRKQSNKAPTK